MKVCEAFIDVRETKNELFLRELTDDNRKVECLVWVGDILCFNNYFYQVYEIKEKTLALYPCNMGIIDLIEIKPKELIGKIITVYDKENNHVLL